ncbi:MAG TPA: hypothetical protein VHO91_08295 [Rhodopila sp.]|nr:hypothetical protein [Rhodopila sp.]
MLDRPAQTAGSAPVPDGDQYPPRISQSASGAGLAPFLSAIRQRRAVLLTVLILIPLCTWLVLRQITPLYTATGALIYEPSGYRVQELQSILRTDPTNEAMMSSQVEVLQSLHIAQKVAERAHLFDDPAFNEAARPAPPWTTVLLRLHTLLGMDIDDPPPNLAPDLAPDRLAPDRAAGDAVHRDPQRDRTLQTVTAALHATQLGVSHVIAVSFTAADPQVAANAVNIAMDAYIKEQYAAKHRAVDTATRLLRAQADQLRQQVSGIEERMSAYRTRHGLSQGVQAAPDTEEITHLTEDLAKARAELAGADARLDAARGRAGAEAQAAVAPSVVTMRTQRDQLAAAIQAQSARLGSAHPEARGLAREYAEAQRALSAETGHVVAAIEADQRAASQRVATLEAMLRQAEAAAEDADRAQIPLNQMGRDRDAARAQLQAVLARIEQTTQQAFIETPEAHEISLALPPRYPSAPHVLRTMAAATAASVFLGLLLIHLLRMADGTVRSGDDLRQRTALPCMALIPAVGKRALGHVPIHDYAVHRPHSVFAEQIRWLRAALALGAGQPRVIAITAAQEAEGVSVLTLALGRSAQTTTDKVLVIECAVRQPSFRARLTLPAAPGMTDILRGEADWRDAVQRDPLSGMDVITAGKPQGDILGLFESQNMRGFLEETREHYSLILLDTPPVEAHADTHVLTMLADATLLCVHWRRTTARTVAHALAVLNDARATVIGTVLMRVDRQAHLRSGYADAAVYDRRHTSHIRG